LELLRLIALSEGLISVYSEKYANQMERIQIKSIRFQNYKGFIDFSLNLRGSDILVGGNNSGKSTILGSLKILAVGIRTAKSRNPKELPHPDGGKELLWEVDLRKTPEMEENLFHNLDYEQTPRVTFKLSDDSTLHLVFTQNGDTATCLLQHKSKGIQIRSASQFKKRLNIEIGYVPSLGPVDRREKLLEKDAANSALNSAKSARNFRNIWFHLPDGFPEFQELVRNTWPSMDVDKPVFVADQSSNLTMLCYEGEERRSREISWAGSGFQVWCQLLTYIIKAKNSTAFLVDEPENYLHPELQLYLLSILKKLNVRVLMATHSTEIIAESNHKNVIWIDKTQKKGKPLKSIGELGEVFSGLGSQLNIFQTMVAKKRRILFVEGDDFDIIKKFADVMEIFEVSSKYGFEPYDLGGYKPGEIEPIKKGIEKALSLKIKSYAIFDRDFRSEVEISDQKNSLDKVVQHIHFHERKEIENYLIEKEPILIALRREFKRKNVDDESLEIKLDSIFERIFENHRIHVSTHLIHNEAELIKKTNAKKDPKTIQIELQKKFEKDWSQFEFRQRTVPGKAFLENLNTALLEEFKVSLTYTGIIKSFTAATIPKDFAELIKKIHDFSKN
jgi:energy-coupling factor transporter ATP-binding protein EcfA2